MNIIKSRRFFSLWFGIGIPPFLIGTIYFSFLISFLHGMVSASIVVLWVFETFSTTCRRCQFYGTMKCGLPSMIVPMIYEKKSPLSLSVSRVKIHYFLDVAMIVYVNFIYAHFPFLFPFVLIGSIVGWMIVFKNKRFHGLLWRLKENKNENIPIKIVD
ncbi:hypothetical protein HH219_21630 [Pseudoalteromonas sp. NEC-BIFX-2020_015]|uniref:hypothetical protein n=1 Tax=Pseudoalteromonas sp. NEC-BIFX-2020_015 TaxID=2729544 RepID=UPI001461420E|nr:hypothetical protein [Pseudoalteromonas sp. NEC-BIFX-2020_015]NMR28081.1 hypothetical protein [Pseudoalteromonas sp. NEC-BIFX-2020_015]